MPTSASWRHSNDGVPALYQVKRSPGLSSWTMVPRHHAPIEALALTGTSFLPWCQLQCVSGPVLGCSSTGSCRRSLHCFVLLGLFSHTKSILLSSSVCHPRTPLSHCAYKSRLSVSWDPCLPHHQYRPAVGNWSHQPALSATGGSATVWHLLPGCNVPQLTFTTAHMTFVSLFSLLGHIQPPEKKLWGYKRLFILNIQIAHRAQCPARLQSKHLWQEQQETRCTEREGRCLETGEERSFVQTGVTSSIIGCTAAGWRVSRGSCRPGGSKSCRIWE